MLSLQVIGQTESGRAQDLWSCGVICYILLAGYPPFFKSVEAGSEAGLLRAIVRGRFHFHQQFWSHISPEAKEVVTRADTI